MMIGAYQPVPKSEHGNIVAHVVRMMKIMVFRLYSPRKERQLSPTPIVPTVSLKSLNESEYKPAENGNQMDLTLVGQDHKPKARRKRPS